MEHVARLEGQVELLLAKIEEQAAEIDELKRRLGENSSNSNRPPSSDSPADRAIARPTSAERRRPL